jgi:hypothetical protein
MHQPCTSRHAAGRAAAQSGPSSTPSTYQDLLEWTRAGSTTPEGAAWRVCVGEGAHGRGLMAMVDSAPGEVLLEVPFSKVFRSDPRSEMHWAAGMGLALLQEQARGASADDGAHARGSGGSTHAGGSGAPAADGEGSSTAADGETGGVDWRPWIRCLPLDVLTPLGWSDAGVAALGDAAMVAEVDAMRGAMHACYEASACYPAYSWGDFLWAVQVFTSRCFFEPTLGCHMAVPGVDMANHSFEPSAAVRVVPRCSATLTLSL